MSKIKKAMFASLGAIGKMPRKKKKVVKRNIKNLFINLNRDCILHKLEKIYIPKYSKK